MAFLRSFGSYLPARVVDNHELARSLGCDPEWILKVSGIAERRYAAASETTIDMGANAAQECLSRAGVDASSIGFVIVSCGSAERRFPGPAAETALRLGIPGIPAIDLPMASAGSLFGLALASRLAESGRAVLVIAAEKMSGLISRPPLDKNTAILFGDGAGACLVDPNKGLAGIDGFSLHSDGAFAQDLCLDLEGGLHMDGRVVILQAARKIPSAIRELLHQHGIRAASVGAFLMHQANQNLTVRVAQALEVAPEKFFSNIARNGNTSSASMLIAAAEWSRHFGFRPSEPVVFAGFGAGFHWGALLAHGV